MKSAYFPVGETGARKKTERVKSVSQEKAVPVSTGDDGSKSGLAFP